LSAIARLSLSQSAALGADVHVSATNEQATFPNIENFLCHEGCRESWVYMGYFQQ